MAGIGFELRRLTARRDYTGQLQAYASAAVVSAGPWIISIVSLMIATWLLDSLLRPDDLRLLTSSITHVYAFALVISGPIQLVLTRHAADCFSEKRREAIFPSLLGSLFLTAVLSGLAGGWFFLTQVPAPPLYQAAAGALLVHVTSIFIISTYLSALRHYTRIVVAFFVGYTVSVVAAYSLGREYGLTGALLGFLGGHLLIAVMLIYFVYDEFGRSRGSPFSFLRAFIRFPDLMLCGLCYNLAIWIDKFLFWWFSQNNLQIAGALHAAPDYDLAIYLSLLSIAPGMAVFFLQVETAFAERFHEYFDAVKDGRPLREITAARHAIMISLREGFVRLLKVQGLTTVVLVVFADHLTSWFHIGYVQTGIFRITLFGALLLVMFLSALTVLFYLDDRRGALWCSLVFLLGNATLSIITLRENEAWYGFGFVVAAGLALLLAASRVNRHLAELDFRTFCVSRR
jgi:uncharacterized membrane protein